VYIEYTIAQHPQSSLYPPYFTNSKLVPIQICFTSILTCLAGLSCLLYIAHLSSQPQPPLPLPSQSHKRYQEQFVVTYPDFCEHAICISSDIHSICLMNISNQLPTSRRFIPQLSSPAVSPSCPSVSLPRPCSVFHPPFAWLSSPIDFVFIITLFVVSFRRFQLLFTSRPLHSFWSHLFTHSRSSSSSSPKSNAQHSSVCVIFIVSDHILFFVLISSTHWGQGVVSWAGTSQVHHKDMDKVPGKNPPGTSQVHLECSQPVSLQCSWVRKWLVHSQCSRSCDQGVPIRNIMGTSKIFPKKVPRIFLSGSFRMFPVPGSGNDQYICSVLGHVTRMFPSGTLWENSQFSQRKYPEFS